MDKGQLGERTRAFAKRVLKLANALPGNVAGREIAKQIIRSGCSVGANYRSALRARSRAEFTSRLTVVLEEADETAYWLELIGECGLMNPRLVTPLRKEAYELVSIFSASRSTMLRTQSISAAKANRSKS